MKTRSTTKSKVVQLPQKLHALFWDCEIDSLSWSEHRDFIVSRILKDGGWEAVQWLRATIGDSELKLWLIENNGGGLPAQKLRFWELVLDLEPQMVSAWLAARTPDPWQKRTNP